MNDDTLLPFDLPSVCRKKLTVDFNGGNQSSNGGVLLLREAERSLGVCWLLANTMTDRRDQSRIRHAMFEMLMARVSAIACGYEDANDLDRLRHDPLMKLAVGRCPESGEALASQSTISRLENAPRKTEAARLCAALIDQFGTTVKPGRLEILDIDDTFCAAHGGQQLAFWNAHHDERGFSSMHIYHVVSGTPVVTILRPARTPKGTEVRTVIKHVTKRLRQHWPNTRIVWRGDGHYGRVEAMEWAENDGADYIFGLAGNPALDALMAETANNLRFHHANSNQPKLRTYASFFYQAGSWDRPRKVVARLECSLQPDTGGEITSTGMRQEVDIRYVVTSHRRILADALRALSDPTDEPARSLRVRDAPRAPDQDRGARDRTYRAHSCSVADELPGGSTVPRRSAWPDAVRPLSHGAARPDEPPTRQINPQCVAQRVDANRS